MHAGKFLVGARVNRGHVGAFFMVLYHPSDAALYAHAFMPIEFLPWLRRLAPQIFTLLGNLDCQASMSI